MSTRSVIVRLEAEVAGYIAGMGRAGRATDDVARQVVQARKATEDNRRAMETAGKVLVAFGAISVAALGASAKAAMDWESAWAGVTKTVDGTPEQMDALEASLRKMATTLPITHEEIAGVAEAAGQLGVAREDLLGFTKTMIDLGVSTNLTAEEAATDIAQIANITGLLGREGAEGIARFGATLVALGNDGASTEKDILSMAQRIAGAGTTVGATESEILALSNTLASMGVRAELGGGVATRVLLKMFSAVKDGGPKLAAFAETAGVSAEQFAVAFGESPIKAMDMVNKGLARINSNGGNVVQVMKDMGIKGTEEVQVMLALANSGNLLNDSLELGAKAWEQNTALIVEATKRYETTESKVKVAWNGIKDAAIDAGAVLLPIIQGIAESVSGLAQTFTSLPAPVKSAITTFAGVVGVAALVGGGLLTLLPKINDTRTAWKDLNQAGSSIPGTLGKIAKAAGLATAALVGFEVIKGLHNSMQPGRQSAEDFTQALVGLRTESRSLDKAFKDIKFGEGDDFAGQINSAGDALNKLINQDLGGAAASFGATVLGIDNGMAKIADAVGKADQSIASAASSGNLDLAAKGFKSIAESAKAQGVEVEKTAERFPLYMSALKELASQAGVSLEPQELLNWAMGEMPDKMKAAAEGGNEAAKSIAGTGVAAEIAAAQSEKIQEALDAVGLSADGAVTDIDKFTQSLFAAGLLSLSASDASIAYQAAIDAVTDSVTKNGKTLDINTEAGRANQSAFNSQAQAAMTSMKATAEQTLVTKDAATAQAELQVGLSQSYWDLIKAAGQFGITGDAADTMARKALGIPKNVNIDAWIADHASTTLDDIKGKADGLDGRVVRLSVVEQYTKMISEIKNPTQADLNGDTFRPGKADGGAVRGPGTGTSDEAGLFWLSDGEHVLDKGDVQKMGGQKAVYKFRENLRTGQFAGLAGGGGVGSLAPARVLVAPSVGSTTVSSTGVFEGNLYLDSGEFLGRVRGIAQQEASSAIGAAGRDIGRGGSV